MKERWKPVPGWEGWYEVSDHGRVRSVDRIVCVKDPFGAVRPRRYRGRVRVLAVSAKLGYPVVNLTKPGARHGAHRYYVHHLVARVFIGPRPHGMDVMHIDETRDNNVVTNLKYGTRSENIRAAYIARGVW